MIKLSNISKRFNDQVVLDGFNLEVEQGEFIVIAGPSGSGKSTLLNIIGLIDTADQGKYELLDYVNVKPYSSKAMRLLRLSIGYLFQNYGLVNDFTVNQNMDIAIRYAKSSDKQTVIMDALKTVGLNDMDKKKVYQLSGGEQQRLAIARLLVKPCHLILADEPTGNLDDVNKDIVLKLLRSMQKAGKTVIVVSHDTEMIDSADRVIYLKNLSETRKQFK